MRIHRRTRICLLQKYLQVLDVISQVLHRDRRILDERDRLVVALDAHHEAEAFLPHIPYILDLLRRERRHDGISELMRFYFFAQLCQLLLDLSEVIPKIFRDENCSRISFDKGQLVRKARCTSGLFDGHAVEELDG